MRKLVLFSWDFTMSHFNRMWDTGYEMTHTGEMPSKWFNLRYWVWCRLVDAVYPIYLKVDDNRP